MKITPIQLAKRVERWQKDMPELGISHWRIERITLTDEDDMPIASSCACVQTSAHYPTCYFYFANEFIESTTPERLDETIIHEWLHVAMRDHDESLDVVENWMPGATYQDFLAREHHTREGLVESLARLIYRLKTT